ncbi:Uncharacterised protein [Cutibacterium granulosum]|uniref:Uncharacterized protein n=1 Tax=Cutibacterium granulosum TaxID=33011 RepID=A0A239W1J7_9ACTN|nr:hypothetical protein [Cutibacterium granulosum]KAG9059847.1 adhesin [Cutibacterium granulosum DSM 20700]SNV27936.1 Uncharacterised protein [Cutibacterium granulosum]
MTTRDNTTEQQYHRAPVEGLAVGAITGTVWVLFFLLRYVAFETPKDNWPYDIFIFIISFVFPLSGWFTGTWVKTVQKYKNPARRKRRIRLIDTVMATLSGVLLTIIYYVFLQSLGRHDIPGHLTLSKQAFVVYLVPLIVFPVAGWILGALRTYVYCTGRHVIRGMSLMTVSILFFTILGWEFIHGVLILGFH